MIIINYCDYYNSRIYPGIVASLPGFLQGFEYVFVQLVFLKWFFKVNNFKKTEKLL